MMNTEFMKGVVVPILTVIDGNEKIDEAGMRDQVEYVIKGGVSGILAFGSNGEFYMVEEDEMERGLRIMVDQAAGRVPVYFGIGAISTKKCCRLARMAVANGAAAVSVLQPMFLKPTYAELYDHFKTIAESVPETPVLLYNNPGRVGYTLSAQLVEELAHTVPNIVGMKDTISGMDHTRELIKVVKSQIPSFEIYSGFDDNFAHNVLAGGNGCIGALSNVVPEVCSAWVRAFRENDLAGIARGQQTIDRLMDLYAIRSPFLPVIKEACKLRGVAASSTGTFPMPNATVEDDAKILELLRREGVE